MPTRAYSVRIPGDLKQAADKKAADERIRSFTDAVDAALNLWVGSDGSAALRKATDRAEEAEAARDEALAELAALRARVAGIAGVRAPRAAAADGASREDRLIAALASATEQMPATRRHLMTVSGYDGSVLGDRLAYLREHGYITRSGQAGYARVPGAHIRKGLQAARDEAAARQREARRTAPIAREAAVEAESSPASRGPAGARKGAAKVPRGLLAPEFPGRQGSLPRLQAVGRRKTMSATALLGSPDAIREAGITYRQLDYWVRRGFLAPEVVKGNRAWTPEAIGVARTLGRLTAAGVSLEAAAKVALSGESRCEIAPGIWIEVR